MSARWRNVSYHHLPTEASILTTTREQEEYFCGSLVVQQGSSSTPLEQKKKKIENTCIKEGKKNSFTLPVTPSPRWHKEVPREAFSPCNFSHKGKREHRVSEYLAAPAIPDTVQDATCFLPHPDYWGDQHSWVIGRVWDHGREDARPPNHTMDSSGKPAHELLGISRLWTPPKWCMGMSNALFASPSLFPRLDPKHTPAESENRCRRQLASVGLGKGTQT